MANLIEEKQVQNPYGIQDTCAYLTVEKLSDLVISDCMPYIGTYTFQFWIKSNIGQTIKFTCDKASRKIYTSKDWSYFSITFDVSKISNIHLTMPKAKYWIYNTKLEIGNIATDWSPHPEDGNVLYDEALKDIKSTLILYQNSIATTESKVDKVNQAITNTVSKTTFTSQIEGIQNMVNDHLDNIEEGYNKWHVSIYDKSLFKNIVKDQESQIETRDKYDISIFSGENANVLPEDEILVPDEPAPMRLDAEGKILYYIAWAKFAEATTIATNCIHGVGTLYLNGLPKLSMGYPGTTPVLLDFVKGWNLIEIITNEGNWTFGTNISQNGNCELFNCLVADPTNRTIKIRQQGAYLNIYLDKILSEVYDVEVTTTIDDQGNEIERKRIIGSKIKQTADSIQMIVQGVDSHSKLTITPSFMEAITNQFIVTGRNGTKVVIEDGEVKADSITSDVMNTNAIISRNYISYNGINRAFVEVQPELEEYARVYEISPDEDDEDENGDSPKNGDGPENGEVQYLDPEDVPNGDDDSLDGRHLLRAGMDDESPETDDTENGDNEGSNSENEGPGENGDDTITDPPSGEGENPGDGTGEDNPSVTPPLPSDGGEQEEIISDFDFDEPSKVVEDRNITRQQIKELLQKWEEEKGFDGAKYSQAGSFFDLSKGNIYTPSMHIDAEHKKAWFKGAVYADEGYFRGTIHATDGDFNGTVYATDGEFNGTVYATDGEFNGTVYATDGVFDGIVHADSGYFNGDLYSNKGQFGPWILSQEGLYKGSNILGAYGNENIYLGNKGFSLGDKFVFDSETGAFTIMPTAITFAGRDMEGEILGQKTFYGHGVPSYNGYPSSEWIASDEIKSHVGNLYYDLDTGKIYSFTETDNVRYKFTFTASTDIYARDFIEIYYRFNNIIYKVLLRVTGEAEDIAPVILPTDSFYIYWHTVKGAARSHYGFTVDTFERIGIEDAKELAETYDSISPQTGNSIVERSQALPNYPIDKSLAVGAFPETAHPYSTPSFGKDQDKIWFVRTNLNGQVNYDWVEIQNQQLNDALLKANKALTFMHYDALNGLILYDSRANLPDHELTKGELDSNSSLKGNVRLTQQGMDVYYGNTLLSSFGQSVYFYKIGDKNNTVATTLDANGLNIKHGSITLGDFENINSTGSGFFLGSTGTLKFGNNNSYIKYDGTEIIVCADQLRFIRPDDTVVSVEDAIASAVSTVDTRITNFISGEFSEVIQAMNDSVLETWRQPSNQPPQGENNSVWNTSEIRAIHVGDLWYQTDTKKIYIYQEVGNDYDWMLSDVQPPDDVMDFLDERCRMFIGSNPPPTPPYDERDLWVNANYTDANGVAHVNEIMRCAVSRISGNFNIADWIPASGYTDDSALDAFIEGEYASTITDVRSQIDQKMQTYIQTAEPGENTWTTPEVQASHVGDIWYDPEEDVYYQYSEVGTNAYDWVEMRVKPPQTLLDRWDNKRQAFVSVPRTQDEYETGDVWYHATWPPDGQQGAGSVYDDETLICITRKEKGENFNISHWVKASKYTDDTSLNTFIDGKYADDLEVVQEQIDQKIQTFYQANEPGKNAQGVETWTLAEKMNHVKDWWYNTTEKKYYIYEDVVKDGVTTYKWVLADIEPPDEVKTLINKKGQIFTDVPEPPYQEGDMWVHATYANLFNNDIVYCVETRAEGEQYNIATDWVLSSRYTDDSALNDFIEHDYDIQIQALKDQDDLKMEMWYQEDNPETEDPIWATPQVKAKHVGDIWYKPSTNVYKTYTSVTENDVTTYSWQEMRVKPPQTLLDKWDSKRQGFISAPKDLNDEYETGDVWYHAVWPETGSNRGSVYNDETLVCITRKLKGSPFSIDHWIKSSKYTDDTSLTTFISGKYNDDLQVVQQQIDGKMQSFYQDTEPGKNAQGQDTWTLEEKQNHVKDWWYNTIESKYYIYEEYDDDGVTKYDWFLADIEPPDEVKRLINSKGQIFTTTPVPPYQVGDMWVKATLQGYFDDDVVYCVHARAKNEQYDLSTDWELSSKYTDDTALQLFKDGEYRTTLSQIEGQIDQKMETYYQDTEPGKNEWTTPVLQNRHIGDIWNDTSTGLYYQYTRNPSDNTCSWVEMRIKPPQTLIDIWDGKRKGFVSQPTPPYETGDVWYNAVWPPANQPNSGSVYNDDILVCIDRKISGTQFDIDDWVPCSKYTDDSSLQTFISVKYTNELNDIQAQIDQKAQTFYQGGNPKPGQLEWDTDEKKEVHVNDWWYNTDDNKYYIYTKQIVHAVPTYQWLLADIEPPDEIKTLIHKKGQIFVSTPEPPYQVGDMWVQATLQGYFSNDVVYCIHSRAEDEQYSLATDWALSSKYTDDTVADQKAQIYIQVSTNDPSTSWYSNNHDERQKHIGDIWVKIDDNSSHWMYVLDGTTYKWQQIKIDSTDTQIQQINNAMDSKINSNTSKIYPTKPSPPYKIGDFWTNAVWPESGTNQGSTYDHELLICKFSRADGSFNIADWDLATKYTDDSVFNKFKSEEYDVLYQQVMNQADGMAEMFYSATDPSTNWTTDDLKRVHIADIWYNTTSLTYSMWTGSSWLEMKTGNYNIINNSNGITIHSERNATNESQLTGANMRLTNTADIYAGQRLLTRYGATTYYYYYNDAQDTTPKTAAELGTEGLFIKNGKIELGTQGQSNFMHFGADGLQLYDRLIYNAETNNLTLKINSLNIIGTTQKNYLQEVLKTNSSHYGGGVPTPYYLSTTGLTTNSQPASTWATNYELFEHVGDIYRDNTTGRAYVFRQTGQETTGMKFRVVFSNSQRFRSSSDYVTIYYFYNQQLYKLTNNVSSGATVILPSPNFYVYFHSTQQSSSSNYYGFEITSIARGYTSDTITSVTTVSNLPSYPIDYSATTSNRPKTTHPYNQTVQNDKIWYVKTNLDSNSTQYYNWIYISNADLEQAQRDIQSLTTDTSTLKSYLHYDATNGLILYNGTNGALPDGVPTVAQLQALKSNVRLKADGLEIYMGNKLATKYGATTQFYKYDQNNVQSVAAELKSDGFYIYQNGQIGDCTIDANNVFHVGADNVTSLNAGVINAGYISTDRLKAGSITASKLVLRDPNNYIVANEADINSGITENHPFGTSANSVIEGGYIRNSSTGYYTCLTGFTSNSFNKDDELYYSYEAKGSSSANGYIVIRFYGAQGYSYSNESTFSSVSATCSGTSTAFTSATFSQATGTIKITEAASKCAYYTIGFYTTSSMTIYLRKAELFKKSGGNLIVHGSITADHLDTSSITVGSIPGLETSLNNINARYGTSSTSYSTQIKVVTCTDYVINNGSMITVSFTNRNTYDGTVYLNVNSKGEKPIYVGGATTSNTNQLLWGAGAIISFIYLSDHYEVISHNLMWYGASSTAANTATKTDTTACTGIIICKGTLARMTMTNANTATSGLALNIGSTGARYVYIAGADTVMPTTKNGYGWPSGASVDFVFDGQYWRIGDTTSARTASAYITQTDSNGIHIHDSNDLTNYLEMNSNGMKIFKNSLQIASFGDIVQIGPTTKNNTAQRNIYIDSSTLYVREGETNIATFGTYTQIGRTTYVSGNTTYNARNVYIDNSTLYIREGTTNIATFGTYTQIGRTTYVDTNGTTQNARNVYIDNSTAYIRNGTVNIATFGTYTQIGETYTNNNTNSPHYNIKIDDSYIYLRKGTTDLATLSGSALTFYKPGTTTEAAKFDSNGLNISYGIININNGQFYVDAQGNLTAKSGTIGGATIANNVLTVKTQNIEDHAITTDKIVATGLAIGAITNLEDTLNGLSPNYGTCTTTASTQVKVVTCEDFEPYEGAILHVRFGTASTYTGSVYLKVNDTQYPVHVNGILTSSTNQLLWATQSTIMFRFEKINGISVFNVIGEPKVWRGSSTTSASTQVKTDNAVACSGCVICKGTVVTLRLKYANTSANVQLNISETGAKYIYAGSTSSDRASSSSETVNAISPTVSNGYSWEADGSAQFVFDGQYWRYGDDAYLKKAIDAMGKITSYVTEITGAGIKVHPSANSTEYVQINSNGVFFYKGSNQIAKYGDEILIGRTDGTYNKNISITSDGIRLRSGTNTLAEYTSNIKLYTTGQLTFPLVEISTGNSEDTTDTTYKKTTLKLTSIRSSDNTYSRTLEMLINSAGTAKLKVNGTVLWAYKTESYKENAFCNVFYQPIYMGGSTSESAIVDRGYMYISKDKGSANLYLQNINGVNSTNLMVFADTTGAGVWSNNTGAGAGGRPLIYRDGVSDNLYIGASSSYIRTPSNRFKVYSAPFYGNIVLGEMGSSNTVNGWGNNDVGRIFQYFYDDNDGGRYIGIATLNTACYMHLGAKNTDDRDTNGFHAKRMYLNADNIYYGPSGTQMSTSDERYKKDIIDIHDSKEFIMDLKPKMFKFVNGLSNRYHAGFIAQDVERTMNKTIGDFGVFCKADFNEKYDETHDDKDLVRMLRYEEIIAPHVAVTQEHEREIQALKNEIAELKQQIKELKNKG